VDADGDGNGPEHRRAAVRRAEDSPWRWSGLFAAPRTLTPVLHRVRLRCMNRTRKEVPQIPRLSAKEAVILRLLLAGGELYGLEIVKGSGGEIPARDCLRDVGQDGGQGVHRI